VPSAPIATFGMKPWAARRRVRPSARGDAQERASIAKRPRTRRSHATTVAPRALTAACGERTPAAATVAACAGAAAASAPVIVRLSREMALDLQRPPCEGFV